MNAKHDPRKERIDALHKALASRILILDGAMGTMIQAYKLDEAGYRGARFQDFAHDLKGNNDLLTLTQPQIIREIHSQNLAAGADIVETNTFNSTSVAMADYHMEHLVHELNLEAAMSKATTSMRCFMICNTSMLPKRAIPFSIFFSSSGVSFPEVRSMAWDNSSTEILYPFSPTYR